jgi:hypothetical protein
MGQTIQIPDLKLEAWSGLLVEPKSLVTGPYMLVDQAIKFVQTETVLEKLSQMVLRDQFP